MNKKIIGAFMISIFLGLGYLAYIKSPFGRRRKAKSIIDDVLTAHQESEKKWEFPKKVIDTTEEELTKLTYQQLELVDDYVQDLLEKKGAKIIHGHQKSLKENKVDWTEDLKHLEDMVQNTTTSMNLTRYTKTAISK